MFPRSYLRLMIYTSIQQQPIYFRDVSDDYIKMVKEIADTAAYSVKFLFLKTIRINVPLCLYSITCFMYHPVFQSLVYQKACLQYGDRIGIGVNCSHREISSNSELQAIANWILLLSSVSICVLGLFTSALIGRLSDTKSRKAALLIPFSGLVLEGASLVVQSYYMELSVYWLVASEALFALFGGYMSIFSSCFAYATDSVRNYSPKCRSLIIAILEGAIGYLCSFSLKLWGFVGLFTAFLVIYIICLIAVFFLPSINSGTSIEIEYKKDVFGFDLIKLLWQQKRARAFIALIVAFAVSFFVFIGSTHISFYYLKFRFGWDAELYGFLKGPTQGLATLNILFIYPILRTYNFTDRTLSLIGVLSRALGRLWLAVTWSTPSTFLLILFDSFSRFAASGMKAISANIVPLKNHGSMFTLFAVTEAFSNLIATIMFHTLFPFSLHFLPQLSFYILAAVMLIPIIMLYLLPEKLTNITG
ncbi:Proton-coupled folate transporter [Dirofilaria immitis]